MRQNPPVPPGSRALAVAALLASLGAGAQEPSPTSATPPTSEPAASSARPGDTVDWHTVVAGETLMGITLKYLGTSSGWRDNWRLNPDVADPDRLTPGQRLRVIVARKVRTAELAALSRKVDEKPFPDPWTQARVGDRLRARDGLRTHERSSALLEFEDQARLYLTEQSVVFLREAGGRLGGVERKSLEIVEGQADLAAPVAASDDEIEIVVGKASATTRGRKASPTHSRSRRTSAGAAQFMVYGGASEVAAAGEKVAVDEGMGTSVPPNAPPLPPEKLLPAPLITSPVLGAILDHSNPVVVWDVVANAAAYVVEACADPACAQLLARHTDVRGTRLQVEPLALGDVFLRVTAVSASGLDGYPAEPTRVSVRSLYRRPPPPPAPARSPLKPRPSASPAR